MSDPKKARDLANQIRWSPDDETEARQALRHLSLEVEHSRAVIEQHSQDLQKEHGVSSALRVDKVAMQRRLDDMPPLVSVSHHGVDLMCAYCEDETKERHTWKQCAEILKVRRDGLAEYIDSGANEGELVLALCYALKPFAERCADYERDNAECGRYDDEDQLDLEGAQSAGRLRVKHLRRALAAYQLVRSEHKDLAKAGTRNDETE